MKILFRRTSNYFSSLENFTKRKKIVKLSRIREMSKNDERKQKKSPDENIFSAHEKLFVATRKFLFVARKFDKKENNRKTFANLWNSEKAAKGSEKKSPFLIFAKIKKEIR